MMDEQEQTTFTTEALQDMSAMVRDRADDFAEYVRPEDYDNKEEWRQALHHLTGAMCVIDGLAALANRTDGTWSLPDADVGHNHSFSQLFAEAVELQRTVWRNDDLIRQEDLFALQDQLAGFVLKLSRIVNQTDQLVEEFSWLYERKVAE